MSRSPVVRASVSERVEPRSGAARRRIAGVVPAGDPPPFSAPAGLRRLLMTGQACHPEPPKPRSGGGQRGIPRNPWFSMVGGGFLAALHPSGVPPARNDSVISASPAPRAVRRLRMTRDSAEHSPLPYSLLATRYSLTVEGAPCLA